jgi:hypothetical protein
MRPSRYLIAPEVGLLFFPEFLTHTLSRAIEGPRYNSFEQCREVGIPNQEQEACQRAGSPGPSRCRPKITVKSEGLSGDLAAQQIQSLQVSLNLVHLPQVAPDDACIQAELAALKASVQSGTFIKHEVKHELRSPSLIIVKHSGEIVDLTLDD